MTFAVVLMTIAGLICLVSGIWLIVLAFRVSLAWGLIVFFLGWTLIPVVVFAAKNWSDAKRPVILYLVGLALSAVSYGLVFAAIGSELEAVAAESADPTTDTRVQTGNRGSALPPPRPPSEPTHPSWEEVVSEMDRKADADWEAFVPSPTPATARPDVLDWHQLASHAGQKIIVELHNRTVTTATLEGATSDRIRVRHVIGGGEAAYWIERDDIALIRLPD